MTKDQIDSLYHKLKSKNLLLNKCPRANFFEAIADQAKRDLSNNETAENIRKALLKHLRKFFVIKNDEIDAPEESSGGQTKKGKLKKTDNIINETGNFFKTHIRIVTEEDDVLYPKQEVNAPSSSSADQNGPIILGRIECDEVKKMQYFNTAKYDDNDIDFPKKTEEDRGKKDGILMRFSVKAAKWVSTLVIFGAVLLGALVTKSTLFVLANAYTQDYSDSRCPYVKEGQVQQYYYPRYMVMLILMSCLCFPEVLVFFYSLWKLLKSTKKKDTTSPPNKLDWRKLVLATVPDIFHAIGLTFLVLKVIPNIDATLACLLFPLVGLVPPWITILTKMCGANRVGVQTSTTSSDGVDPPTNLKIGITCCLLSVGYFIICGSVYEQDRDVGVTACTFLLSLSFAIYAGIDGNKFVVSERTGGDLIYFKDYNRIDKRCSRIMTSFWFVGITHCLSSLGTFLFGTIACKTLIQIQGFFIPLSVATPLMSAICGAFSMMQPYPEMLTLMDFFGMTPKYRDVNDFISWKTYQLDDLWKMVLIVVIGWATASIGLSLLTSYIWYRIPNKLEKKEFLFVKPIFAGPFISESLMLNRRQYPRNNKVHVLFDDAFKDGQLNDYVNRLLELIGPAAEKISEGSSNNIKGTSCETPYGGRIKFELPWGKYFNIHLKDNSKIKHRKRWSQCMYMHYILKYLQREENFDLENTYLLALDGDVDFQPTSLTTLLDLMKRDKNLGAACGRIHPIGSGPVVWFQKFEYAVGHWLQKTTEDVLGCVLCSPGCFSLFRGSALIEPNVAGNYSNIASSPQQKIQWDQGEDRWLCTLLLKAGKKIEYCAVSDSYTFAPEEFKEFYDQRRRWGPSTLANVFDILLDAKLAIRENECISHGYIAYQIGLMAASLLGPATVVLIIQGAFQYVFGMSPIGGLMAALIPVIFFVIICYTTNLNFQIIVAQILSLIYALVMMAVLVGVIGQMVDNILNPTSLFMLVMIGMFGITGILHPSEILCLLHGVLYYICVPSAFIFLVIYSYCNMHDVTWGTREEKSPDENKQKAPSKDGGDIEMQNGCNGNYRCGWLNSCKCAMCLSPYKLVPTEEPRDEKNMKQNKTRETQNENQTNVRSDESSTEKTACRKQSKKWWNLEDHALFKNMEVL
uniref:uncharacterized protein LOC120326565 n=1 Tax=Styela clava TaxID=7725 RepID=UPI001939A556|nr:uncharacterized protein LOC120326565 [Styela clava]